MEAVKTRTMSVCGVQCDACEHYPDICLGCKALEGKAILAAICGG